MGKGADLIKSKLESDLIIGKGLLEDAGVSQTVIHEIMGELLGDADRYAHQHDNIIELFKDKLTDEQFNKLMAE